MKKSVFVCKIPFGSRVFIHKDGAIREVIYEGMITRDSHICGGGVYTKHMFWFGNHIGTRAFDERISIYRTIEDASAETNKIPAHDIDLGDFSSRYIPRLNWDGIQFTGWVWDGSRPVKRATREYIDGCLLNRDGVTFLDRNGNPIIVDLDRFYKTAEDCRENNKPRIVMLDDNDNESHKRRFDEFKKFVADHCPGFEDKIDESRFEYERSMPENMSIQVGLWMENR